MRALLFVLPLGLAACAASHVAVDSRPAVSVMAYNVLYRGGDDVRSLDAIVHESPELVCVTELTPAFVGKFAQRFPRDYPYRRVAPREGALGVGVFSRRRIERSEVVAVGRFKRPAMLVTVDFDGRPIDVMCVHLMPPNVDGLVVKSWNEAARADEGAFLATRLKQAVRPVLVIGDFNENVDGPALSALRKIGFTPACQVADRACSATFPGPALRWPAVFTIDHIVGRGVEFREARTVREGGSDHYPVSAEVIPIPSPRPDRDARADRLDGAHSTSDVAAPALPE